MNNPHSLFCPRGIHIAFGPRDTFIIVPFPPAYYESFVLLQTPKVLELKHRSKCTKNDILYVHSEIGTEGHIVKRDEQIVLH